jgi:hypothetical protein
VIAEGFERLEALPTVLAGLPIRWTERRLVRRSQPLAQAGERGLRARLAKAEAAIAALNDRRWGKRRGRAVAARQAAVAVILARDPVQGLLQVQYTAQERWQSVRRYGDRPPRRCRERG